MRRGKSIKMFLMDGISEGRIKCKLSGWTGVAYKIPEPMLKQSTDIEELNYNGIYFLLGTQENSAEKTLYVGQARQRKNGAGVKSRIVEPHDSIAYWTEVIVLTTVDNSFGMTALSYLENKFYNIALKGLYNVANKNEPSVGNPSVEETCELDDFIDAAKLVIGALGYHFFDDIPSSATAGSLVFRMEYAGVKASGMRTADGFAILPGSEVREMVTKAFPDNAKRYRERYKDKIVDWVVKETLLFSSPSAAASFIAGNSMSGNSAWHTENGKKLGDLLLS